MQSLKRNCDFQQVFKAGKAKSDGSSITVFLLSNGLNVNRLGVTVSKKTARSAVTRNRIRRRIKEAYRLIHKDLAGGHDLVILPKEHLAHTSFAEIAKTLKSLFERHGIL